MDISLYVAVRYYVIGGKLFLESHSVFSTLADAEHGLRNMKIYGERLRPIEDGVPYQYTILRASSHEKSSFEADIVEDLSY